MANPEHTPDLDGFDRLTVVLYRSGIVLAGLAACAGVVLFALIPISTAEREFALELLSWIYMLGIAMSTICLHIYSKRIRWLMLLLLVMAFILPPLGRIYLHLMFTQLILPEQLIDAAHQITLKSQMWVFIGTSVISINLAIIAWKEQYCFKLKAFKLIPFLLVATILTAWTVIIFELGENSTKMGVILLLILTGLTGLLVLALGIAKWLQPLHFDVGNKDRYEV